MDDDYGPGVDLDGRKSRKGGSGVVLPGSEGYNKGASYNLNGTQVDADGNEIKNQKRNDAAEDLRNNEDASVNKGGDEGKAGLPGVREKEESGGFTSSVTGKKSERGKKKGKGGIKGILKKKGPMGLIIGLIFGGGALFGGAQMLMPFSLLAQFTETFNSMHTSVNVRSNAFLRMQLDSSGRVTNPIKGKIFGPDEFKITKKQAAKLATQGIEVSTDVYSIIVRENSDGSLVVRDTQALLFDDGTGQKVIVVADVDIANEMRADGRTNVVDFDTLYKTNPDFFNGYNKASMTWRGAISNWFGTMTAKFLQSNKITRNMFKNFQQKIAEADAGNTRTVALEIMENGTEETKRASGHMREVELDENGDPIIEDDGTPRYKDTEETVPGEVINRKNVKTDPEIKAVLEKVSNQYSSASKGAGIAQKVANYSCLAVGFLGGVNLLVTASEVLQIKNLVSGYFEAINKTQAGDGSDSPINDLAGALVERVNDGDSNGKSAMESAGIAALYSGRKVDPNDKSVKSFSFIQSAKTIFGAIGISMEAFYLCSVAKIVANLAGATISIATIFSCVAGIGATAATAGAGAGALAACLPLLGNVGGSIVVGLGAGVAISKIIEEISPIFAKLFTRDLIANIGGEDLGNALVSGANIYLGNTHRANGGSLANREHVLAFRASQQEVIAENAKYERQTRSPFDLTSKYTFMGTLMTQMMGFLSSSSLLNMIKSGGSVISSSVVAMSPAAMAYDISKDLYTDEEYAEMCPYLASIGATGDAYCNPYTITDLSTIETDPLNVIEKIGDNFMDEGTEYGNVIIKGDSDLAKYIVFCDERASAFGVADQNIANQVNNFMQFTTDNRAFNNVANSAIGSIPLVGDMIDIVGNEQARRNVGYISGESCVAGNDVSGSSPNWDMAKYYQRFIEDQSLAETIGLFGENGKSAVTAFLDDYYEKNPLDNSYEGILARYSGLEKDTVIALLDIIEYGNYIANYHPEERLYFGEPATEEKELKFDNEHTLAVDVMMLLGEIVYADVRNRNFVV